MNVPLLDLRAHLEAYKTEAEAAVLEVLGSTRYVMGPKVEELEAQIADYCGAAHAVGCSSGTDALLLCLMSLGVGPGDIVVTTTYSFFATAGVIARLNAKPVFIDIDPDTYNIDPAALRRWFEHAGEDAKRVKAIIPVHLYGQCADMDPILDIAREQGVRVIEDAAQAIGATYPGRDGVKKAGAMGDFGCFSFYPTKNLGGIGDSGLITTNDPDLADHVRKLRIHGTRERYYHDEVGGNFRIDPIQAAVLLVKLPHLENWHAGRRRNADFYDQKLAAVGVKTPKIAYGREHHIYNQYVIQPPGERDALRAFLAERGVGSDVYYPLPFHLQNCFADLGYRAGDFPNAEQAAKRTLALPIYPELAEAQRAHVAESIAAFCRG